MAYFLGCINWLSVWCVFISLLDKGVYSLSCQSCSFSCLLASCIFQGSCFLDSPHSSILFQYVDDIILLRLYVSGYSLNFEFPQRLMCLWLREKIHAMGNWWTVLEMWLGGSPLVIEGISSVWFVEPSSSLSLFPGWWLDRTLHFLWNVMSP